MASTFAGKYTGVADSGSRGAAPFTAVLVNVHGGGAATLYLNRTKAFTVTNPVTSGGDGRYTMFADPGVYDVVVAGFTTSVTVTPDAAEYAAGLPPGGTVGQIPAKLSSADGDVGWTANGGGSGQSVPLASQQAGIVDDATTYDDTIAANSGIEGLASKITTLVIPANMPTSALAIAFEGEAFPRMLLMTDSYDGLVGFAFSDGTFDPFNSDNPAGLFVNGGQLTLSGPNQTPISGILTTGVEVVTDDIPLHIHNADNTATVDITFSGSEVDFAVTGASGHFEVNTVSQSVICRTMNFMCPTNPFSFHFLSDVTNTDVSVIVIDDATSGAGDDNDWAFGVDGHIYFKTGGIWVLKI